MRSRNTLSRTCCGSVFRSRPAGSDRAARRPPGSPQAICCRIARRPHVERDGRRAVASCRYGRKKSGGTSPLHLAVLRVRARAPTISMSSGSGRRRRPHPLADGVAAELELLRERLVDDRDLLRASASARVNSRPAEQRDAQRARSSRADLVDARVRVGVRARLEALHRDVVAPVAAGQQRHRRRGRRR